MYVLTRWFKCQMGHDSRINNVQLIFGNKAAIRDVKVPVLYLMNDAKEGDIFYNRMLSHHPSSNRHCRTCDIQFDNLNDPEVACALMQATTINNMMDNDNIDGLQALTMYKVDNAFRRVEFCDPIHNIYGAQPVDILHAFQSGPLKQMLDVFFVLIAEKSRDKINNMSRELYKNNKCTIR